MDAKRLINNIFELSQQDKIGIAFNKLIKTSDALNEWTNGRIIRSASAFEPIDGIVPPYILTQILTIGTTFYPTQKERNRVNCGALFVYEEPYKSLEEDDITIVSVVDEFKRILLTDPFLKIDDDILKTERIHDFELASYGGRPEEDKVTIYAGYRVEYFVDLNYLNRMKT